MVATPNRLAKQSQSAPAAEDHQLKRRLVNFLYDRQVPDTDDLNVESHGGTVVISGRLPSRHDKWLCLECCRRVAGVIRLVDQVDISPASAVSAGQS